MQKPKRRIKAFYVVTGKTIDGNNENITEFTHKGQIFKGLRKIGLDFDKYQSITIHKSPIVVYEYAKEPNSNHYRPKSIK
ncbi:hypothetical protein [Histophilus somni]|uniref:hypothetical protein n=1 Tax=Histophilus somni TaxID=731 RepID=UPI00201E8E30|nr:hypothetical protein [Histophilus somni]